MTAGGPPTPLQRLRLAVEHIKVGAAYASVGLIVVVFYFGDFLGDFKNVLLPAALGVAALYFIQSLQTIEGNLATRFASFQGTLEGRFRGIEGSLERVEEQQKGWRDSLPLLEQAQQTGLQAVCPTAGRWAPPEPNKVFVAAGMRVRYVQESEFRAQLTSVLRTGGEVTLVMSDPRSQRVWARYRDEPDEFGMGNQMVGLADLLRTVKEWCNQLQKDGVDTRKLTVKISGEYPLAAYYRVDESIFTYSYPYKSRGLESPVYQFSTSGPVGSRLCQFLEAVVNAAKPLDDAEYANLMDRWTNGELNDNNVLGPTP